MASRQSGDDPEANCLPTGIPRTAPYPWRMLQTQTHIFILFEGNIHSYRQVFMDGRKHPDDPDPTWYGHSIGWYEGDTLVIDTIGLRDDTWIDWNGSVLTQAARVREQIRRPDFGHLEIQVTVDDPKAYTKPWTVKLTQSIKLDTDLLDFGCTDNEKDVPHLSK